MKKKIALILLLILPVLGLEVAKAESEYKILVGEEIDLSVESTNGFSDVTWTVDNPSVVSYSTYVSSISFLGYSKSSYGITVRGLKKGTVTLTANSITGKSATATIIVEEIPLTKISFNKKVIELNIGQTEKITAQIEPANTTDNKNLTWKSSNTSVASVDNNGNILAKKKGTTVVTATTQKGLTASVKVSVLGLSNVNYQTGVQKKGWLSKVSNGDTSGTVGSGLRMESLKVSLSKQEFTGNIEYRTHIQKKGWESAWKKNGELSGTVGEGLRLEAVQIRLTGEMASHYDIYYRVHAQKFGWLDWTKNGESAGTAGFGYRLEAIQIVLVEKGSAAPGSTTKPYVKADYTSVTYQTQVQKKGWLNTVSNGVTSGTVGQGLRMESLKINLKNQGFSGNIEYRTHIQKQGWESTWKKNGATSGTVGLGLRLEALQLRLTGEMAKEYDIYYRVQAQKFGWLGWAKNGESAGTAGFGYRLEAIQIVLVRKGMTPPGNTANHFYSK